MEYPQDPTSEELTLCCGGRKSCPKIQHKSGRFSLSDEEKGAGPVEMERDEFELLVRWGAQTLGLQIQE